MLIGDSMELGINNQLYQVIINKKRIQNIYIRVDQQLNIVVSVPHITSHKEIKMLLEKETDQITKMIERMSKRSQEGDYLLGEKIDVVVLNEIDYPMLEEDILFIPSTNYDYYNYLSKKIYEERLKEIYSRFEEAIPYPKLKIRKMTSKWGVCNKRNTSITLNQELIKKAIIYIDYVIIHELSHFVHMNHSSDFWSVVSKYMPQYKQIRKELRE